MKFRYMYIFATFLRKFRPAFKNTFHLIHLETSVYKYVVSKTHYILTVHNNNP